VIAHLLSSIPYQRLEPDDIAIPDRPGVDDVTRPPRELHRYVPDVAGALHKKKK